MRLLDRYLLRELLVPLGYCLAGFAVFWNAFQIFGNLSMLEEHKLGAVDVIEYYFTKTPEFLVNVVPIALLLGLLYTLTNLARHNEITAMRAAGLSLWRICAPFLVVGVVASLALFAVDELWAPGCTETSERILNRHLPDRVAEEAMLPNAGTVNSADGRLWMAAGYDPRTGVMVRPQLFQKLPDGSEWVIRAARAVRTNGVWTFYDAYEFRAGAETNSMLVPLLHTNTLTMPQLLETPAQILSEINIAKGMSVGSFKRADVPLLQILDYERLHPAPPDSMKAWLYTKLQGRLAAPWTCLVVVLIAMPFGAASGRRNVFVGVAASLLICAVYMVLQQFSMALGTGGLLRPWVAAWFPNLLFGLTGICLSARVR